jgi:hypothetical protein
MKSLEKTGFCCSTILSEAERNWMLVGMHFAPDREARNAVFYGLIPGFCRQNFGFCNFWSLSEQLVRFGK